MGWGKSVCMPCVCVEVSGPLPRVRAFPLYHVGCRDQMWVIRSASKYPPLLSHLASPNILLFQARKIWRLSALRLSSSLTHSLENYPGVTNDQLSLVLSFKFESGKMHTPYWNSLDCDLLLDLNVKEDFRLFLAFSYVYVSLCVHTHHSPLCRGQRITCLQGSLLPLCGFRRWSWWQTPLTAESSEVLTQFSEIFSMERWRVQGLGLVKDYEGRSYTRGHEQILTLVTWLHIFEKKSSGERRF